MSAIHEHKPAVTWNPGDYAANSASQQAWARELIARLKLTGHETVLDIGCGDGKVTAELARSVPKGAVTGIDASAEMIRFAQRAFPRPAAANLNFAVMDARHIKLQQRFDLAFSNAALHWVDDHPGVLRGVAACLKPGGRLVISCGGKGNAQDVFLALRGLMRLKRWKEFFRNVARPYFFFSPEDYRAWLPQFGFRGQRIELAPKDMAFDTVEKFTGWFRTTWLPYTQRVPESQREAFIAAVVERFLSRHPVDTAGRVHVGMVRLEIEAVKL